MVGERSASASDHAYFQALEAEFIRLRGAPLLLSPADWQVAKSWRREGIPIELVVRVMERIFERKAEGGKPAGIRSLRYFRKAVASSWRAVLELGGGDRRTADALPDDLAARLARLAASLPHLEAVATDSSSLDDAAAVALEGIAGQVAGLAELAEGPAQIEGRLQELDRLVVERLRRSLEPETLAKLEAEVRDGLSALAARLGSEAREQTFEILLRRKLRELLNLPVLSLFSREAESRAEPTED